MTEKGEALMPRPVGTMSPQGYDHQLHTEAATVPLATGSIDPCHKYLFNEHRLQAPTQGRQLMLCHGDRVGGNSSQQAENIKPLTRGKGAAVTYLI